MNTYDFGVYFIVVGVHDIYRKSSLRRSCKRIFKNEFMEAKWFWKMDYCKKRRIPPAQTWAWDEAEKAYNNQNIKT